MTICHGPDTPGRYLFETNCGLNGLAGTRLAGAVKSCCPRANYTPQNGNQSGLNCAVSCNTLTAQEAIDWNPCLNDYYDNHDENEETWTCNTPDPNAAVRGRSTGWGGLVVLCLAVSTAVTML